MPPEPTAMDNGERGTNLGWIAGGLVILGVFVVGGYFWFSAHP